MTLLGAELPAAADIWALLDRGVVDRRSPFRTPTVATVGADGVPAVRTVVLRAVERPSRSLVLHSDTRAGKVQHLSRETQLAWHFWHPRQRVQVRATGPAVVARSGPDVDTAWAALSVHQQRTYGACPGPGTALDVAGDGLPDVGEAEAGRAHFCVVTCRVQRLDVLELARAGHRRCVYTWRDGSWAGQWVVP